MAALGWLMNLDFAAGGAAAPGGGIGNEVEDEVAFRRRSPYEHSYGYHYIVRGVTWMISSLLG